MVVVGDDKTDMISGLRAGTGGNLFAINIYNVCKLEKCETLRGEPERVSGVLHIGEGREWAQDG